MNVFLRISKASIKVIYIQCLRMIQNVKWVVQFYLAKCLRLYPRNLTRLRVDEKDKILILVPHADDEWIGPYAIVQQKFENLTCVYFNLFGNDYSEENICRRNAELMESKEFWGYSLVNNCNYDIDSLAEMLKNSEVCFLPSPYDWHEEHRKVFKTFVKAYEKLSQDEEKRLNVYYYCVSVPHSKKENLSYVPLSKKDLDDKWTKFKDIYHSQSFMPSLRYKLQLRLIPTSVGYAAQTFIKVDGSRLNEDNLLIETNAVSSKLTKLQNYINNIVAVRLMIEKVKHKYDAHI